MNWEIGDFFLKVHTSSFSDFSHLMYFQVLSIGIFLLIQVGFLNSSWNHPKSDFSPDYGPHLIMGTSNPIFHAKIPMSPRYPQSHHLSDGVTSALPVTPLDSFHVNQTLSTVPLNLGRNIFYLIVDLFP